MYSRVYVEVTNVCNMNCSFCHGHSRAPRRMTAAEFSSVLDALMGQTQYIYYHLMGEPLTHPELPDFVRMAKERGFHSAVTTNGTLLGRHGHALIEAGVYKFNISLHSFEGGNDEHFYRYLAEVSDFADLADRIAMMTVAPDVEGALSFIEEAPFRISLGHTAADYDTARAAFRAGADCMTHTFNAMSPLHHRDPAVIGAALTEGAFAQVISDGIHLHPATVLLLYRAFGSDRMILISDAISATGLSDGDYMLGGKRVLVRDGIARNEAGALSGSTVTLHDCVRRAISFGIPRDEALKMASLTPAAYLGVKKGKVAVGYDADLLVVDEELNILETILCDQL